MCQQLWTHLPWFDHCSLGRRWFFIFVQLLGKCILLFSSGTYKEGDMVELANLQAQDWNGKVGTLLQWLGGERRWKVRVDVDDPDFRGDGGDHSVVKNIKEENFRAAGISFSTIAVM